MTTTKTRVRKARRASDNKKQNETKDTNQILRRKDGARPIHIDRFARLVAVREIDIFVGIDCESCTKRNATHAEQSNQK